MARQQKAGLDYFPLDVNIFSDNKIRILKARYGVNGVSVYIYLLCEIYKNGYYMQWNDDLKFILADELNLTDGFIEQVLKFLLERSLFDGKLFQSDTILTSPGIQRRYQLAVKERAKKTPIRIKGFWLLEAEETEPFIKVNPDFDFSKNLADSSGKNNDNSQKNDTKESKGKKTKENKKICSELETSPRPDAAYHLPLLDGSFYPVMPEEVEKYRGLYPAVDTGQEFRKMIGWLDANPKNRKTQRGILKFINGWLARAQDSARPVGHTGSLQAGKNRFHNFEQRDTDYDALVLQRTQEFLREGETDG